MCEILFRGKRTDNGEWVQSGNIIHFNDENAKKLYFIPKQNDKNVCVHDENDNILSFEKGTFYKVIPETIGQYTGLTDKNGKKIFEGDVVKVYEDIDYRVGVHKTNRKTRTIIGVVVFDEKRFEYQIKNEEYNLTLFRLSKKDTNEVIGNIHDNPELLKERESNANAAD